MVVGRDLPKMELLKHKWELWTFSWSVSHFYASLKRKKRKKIGFGALVKYHWILNAIWRSVWTSLHDWVVSELRHIQIGQRGRSAPIWKHQCAFSNFFIFVYYDLASLDILLFRYICIDYNIKHDTVTPIPRKIPNKVARHSFQQLSKYGGGE